MSLPSPHPLPFLSADPTEKFFLLFDISPFPPPTTLADIHIIVCVTRYLYAVRGKDRNVDASRNKTFIGFEKHGVKLEPRRPFKHSTHIYVYISLYVYIYIYIHTHICIHTYMYIYIYMYMYTYMYI